LKIKIDLQNLSSLVFKTGTTALMNLHIAINATDKDEKFLGIANKQSP